jgi:hypothetical protein
MITDKEDRMGEKEANEVGGHDVGAIRETTLIRERNTVGAATAILSEPSRAERDRLLISAAACVLVCLPGHFEKIAIGPVEFSKVSAAALRIGSLISVFYFAITFATQALMDLSRWKATFRIGLIDLMPRLDIHNKVLGERSRAAQEHHIRFTTRIEAHQADLDPLIAELLAETNSLSPNFVRVSELELQIAAARNRLAADNALDDHPYTESPDYNAVLGIEKRVSKLRLLMWTNVVVTITMPLIIAALAACSAIWLFF